MAAPRRIRLLWDQTDRAGWERLLAAHGRAPLEQSWAWGEAAARGRGRPHRGVYVLDGRPVGLVQAIRRTWLKLLTTIRIERGPLLLAGALAPVQRLECLVHLRLLSSALMLRSVQLVPELPEGEASERLLAEAGFRQIKTGQSTIWLDLAPEDAALRRGLGGKWRNQLRAGERSGLAVEAADGGPALDWLIERHDALRRRRRFSAIAGAEARALATAGDAPPLVLRALAGGEPVAGVLFVRHGAAATYLVAWTGEEGRRACAHNLLLWRGLLALKGQGVRWLDLGGINYATVPGISHFKAGLGGEPVTLAGLYI